MSDYANKSRSILELIASLNGKSCGVNVMGGSGGMPVLTDQDVAGAVAMARQYKAKDKPGKRPEAPLMTCVRPELLLLHWAGRSDLVPIVAKRCADAISKSRDDARLSRAASLVAAQLMAGRNTDADLSAWAMNCTRAQFEHEMGWALAWMRGELSEAESAYCRAMKKMIDERSDIPASVSCRLKWSGGQLKLRPAA